MRLLMTGSRTWTDSALVWWALDQALNLAQRSGAKLTLVHGAASDGADAIAAAWAHMRGMEGRAVDEEPHPADWALCVPSCRHREKRRKRTGEVYCPLAGHRRNAAMVNLGADYCLAFVCRCPCPDTSRNGPSGMHGTHGTVNCMDLAAAAGITVRPFRPRSAS